MVTCISDEQIAWINEQIAIANEIIDEYIKEYHRVFAMDVVRKLQARGVSCYDATFIVLTIMDFSGGIFNNKEEIHE